MNTSRLDSQPSQHPAPGPVETDAGPLTTRVEFIREGLLSLLTTVLVLFLGGMLGRWMPVLIGPWTTGIATTLVAATAMITCSESRAILVLRFIGLTVLGANVLDGLGLVPLLQALRLLP